MNNSDRCWLDGGAIVKNETSNMNDAKEKMSAMLDGELAPDQVDSLIRQINNNPELQRTWERYHVASAAMHGEQGQYRPDLSQRIIEQLKLEPVMLVPEATVQPVRRWTQALAGLAIAASVAAVAVFGLPSLFHEPTGNELLAGKSIEQGDYIRAGNTHWKNDSPALEQELNLYLVEHNAYSPVSNLKGIMGYGAVAGYDNASKQDK